MYTGLHPFIVTVCAMPMENADQQVLKQLTNWVSDGQASWLCTVVKTWGSSPRPIGSLLCCNSQGHLAGSLSGGCIEEDLLDKLQDGTMARDTPEVLVYGVTQAETEKLGLPCGGQLHVVVEPFPDKRHLPVLEQVLSRLEDRNCIERTVDIATGDMTVENRQRFQHLKFNGEFSNTSVAGEKSMTQTYGPRYQLVLIGCGQVSQYLAEMAKALDYHVIVCDPREHLMEQWPVEGIQLITGMPDDVVRAQANDQFSAIIALTHDPRIDDMGLMEALTTEAYFIGAMGSRKTSENRRHRLKQLDLTDAQINRLHAPVGLPIGSKTPAEIAIAILAQLTALRSEKIESLTADYREVPA
ncbi:MAG: XdhC family protein [Pseudomonadota bacterium]|jgi:xanthine dehydrogenase accessory factor|nr:XdhC family protein [Pseudomonadota bacterium]